MRLAIALLLSISGIASAAGQPERPKLDDEMRDKYLVVLGSDDDFHAAKQRAVAASHMTGTPFSLRGLVFDKKRGLILPDSDADDVYAGGYLLRRYNEAALVEDGPTSEFISIERADAYEGLHDATYIELAGIYDTALQAERVRDRLAATAPGARVEKTRLYMGCMH